MSYMGDNAERERQRDREGAREREGELLQHIDWVIID